MQKVELGVDVCFICAASTSIGHPACLGAFDQLLQLKAELGKDKDVAKTLQHPVISFIFFLSCWSSPCFRSLLSFFFSKWSHSCGDGVWSSDLQCDVKIASHR